MPWKSALRKREFFEMRLDIFAAGVYSECYVVFADNTSLWWLKLLKPGFRHCYVILRLYKTGRWLELNPLSNQFLAAIYDYPPDFDFPGYIRTRRNVRLCRVEIAAAPPKCAPLSFLPVLNLLSVSSACMIVLSTRRGSFIKKYLNCRKKFLTNPQKFVTYRNATCY